MASRTLQTAEMSSPSNGAEGPVSDLTMRMQVAWTLAGAR